MGEPFVSYFAPATIEAKLFKAGFTQVEFLLPEEANSRYYAFRPRDLPVPRTTRIACAIR
jgi:hypothetical protein